MGTIVEISEVQLELGLGAAITDEELGIIQQCLDKAEGSVKSYLQYDPVQAVRTEFYPLQNFMGSRHGRASVWETDATEAFLRDRTGAASDQLQIRHLPIRFTDSAAANPIDLRIDFDGRFGAQSGSFAITTQKTQGTDYWPVYDGNDGDGIALSRSGNVRSIGRWPSEPGSVRITYVGGYTQPEFRGDGLVDASPIWAVVVDEVRRRVIKAFMQRKVTGAGFVPGLSSERLGDYSYTLDSGILQQIIGGNWALSPESRQDLDTFVNYGWALAS